MKYVQKHTHTHHLSCHAKNKQDIIGVNGLFIPENRSSSKMREVHKNHILGENNLERSMRATDWYNFPLEPTRIITCISVPLMRSSNTVKPKFPCRLFVLKSRIRDGSQSGKGNNARIICNIKTSAEQLMLHVMGFSAKEWRNITSDPGCKLGGCQQRRLTTVAKQALRCKHREITLYMYQHTAKS